MLYRPLSKQQPQPIKKTITLLSPVTEQTEQPATVLALEDIRTKQDYLEYCQKYCRDFLAEDSCGPHAKSGRGKAIVSYVRCGPLPKYASIGEVGRRRPQGVVVGYKENGKIKLGWSLCKKNETFYPKVGLYGALKRAAKSTNPLLNYGNPHTVASTMKRVYDRLDGEN